MSAEIKVLPPRRLTWQFDGRHSLSDTTQHLFTGRISPRKLSK